MTERPAELPRKPSLKSEQRQSSKSTSKDASPVDLQRSKPYNAEEVLLFLSASYESELNRAKQDKAGETYRVYQSLESSSAWSTKTNSSSKRSSTSDEYSLLRELNRCLRRPSQK